MNSTYFLNKGDGAAIGQFTKDQFSTAHEFVKYQAEEYEHRQWAVSDVHWSLNPETSDILGTLTER